MKRRTFILTAIAASVAIAIPALNCGYWKKSPKDILAWPEDLAEITDEKNLREIGIQYQKEYEPFETKEQIRELLMTAQNSQLTAPTNDSSLRAWLKEKIRNDFSSSRTLNIKGWVISITEIQQCTLFSFR